MAALLMGNDEWPSPGVPTRLWGLHESEELLRGKALAVIDNDERLQLHLVLVERTMDLIEIFRRFDTQEEDLKLIQILAIRIFNAFSASLKLALSGYSQNSALIMRDILETVFLLDLFNGDRSLIERWRTSEKKERMKVFSPVRVREALDARDGFTSRKRAEAYEMFSELAGHPTMKSAFMLRPKKDGDAVLGPFMEASTLEAVLSEMGRLGVQAGEATAAFIPAGWVPGAHGRLAFAEARHSWLKRFYPHVVEP